MRHIHSIDDLGVCNLSHDQGIAKRNLFFSNASLSIKGALRSGSMNEFVIKRDKIVKQYKEPSPNLFQKCCDNGQCIIKSVFIKIYSDSFYKNEKM